MWSGVDRDQVKSRTHRRSIRPCTRKRPIAPQVGVPTCWTRSLTVWGCRCTATRTSRAFPFASTTNRRTGKRSMAGCLVCAAYHARDTISGASDHIKPLAVACLSLLTFGACAAAQRARSRARSTWSRDAPHRCARRAMTGACLLALRPVCRCSGASLLTVRTALARATSAVACASRTQSKPMPGSCFRVGATCSWPTTAVDAIAARQRAQQRAELRVLRALEALALRGPRARCRSNSRCSCRARATATRPHAMRDDRTKRTATIFP